MNQTKIKKFQMSISMEVINRSFRRAFLISMISVPEICFTLFCNNLVRFSEYIYLPKVNQDTPQVPESQKASFHIIYSNICRFIAPIHEINHSFYKSTFLEKKQCLVISCKRKRYLLNS